MLPSVSLQYASQPTVGTAIFGTASVAPAFIALSTCVSRFGTSIVHTKQLTAAIAAGAPGCGRGISPPSMPGCDLSPVTISQYLLSPHWLNCQSNTVL